jgi:hypothetical protein
MLSASLPIRIHSPALINDIHFAGPMTSIRNEGKDANGKKYNKEPEDSHDR